MLCDNICYGIYIMPFIHPEHYSRNQSQTNKKYQVAFPEDQPSADGHKRDSGERIQVWHLFAEGDGGRDGEPREPLSNLPFRSHTIFPRSDHDVARRWVAAEALHCKR